MQRVFDIELLAGSNIEVVCGCDALSLNCSAWVWNVGLPPLPMYLPNNAFNCTSGSRTKEL